MLTVSLLQLGELCFIV